MVGMGGERRDSRIHDVARYYYFQPKPFFLAYICNRQSVKCKGRKSWGYPRNQVSQTIKSSYVIEDIDGYVWIRMKEGVCAKTEVFVT